VVPPGKPEELAKALRQLIEDKALRKRYGAANRKLVNNYSWDYISRRYLECAKVEGKDS
jgi:glycosyltransferase involved in cell wall biosynthesis